MYRPPYGTILFNTTCIIGKNMEIQKLQRAIIDGLEDVKAQDIKVFNTTHLTALFDRVIVASGTSNRQTKALANSVREKVKELGGDVISTEGEEIGEWVLVDCGDAVVHILQPALRQYYNLEELWGEGKFDKVVNSSEPVKTVRRKSGAAPRDPRKTRKTQQTRKASSPRRAA